LITGADGYVGAHIAERVLADGDDRVVLAVRAANAAEFHDKRARLSARLGVAATRRVSYASVDLRQPHPFADIDDVTRIVHAAAATRLNVSYSDALTVNVEGTARCLEWARQCPSLERFALISTLYVAGRRRGNVAETHLRNAGFVNHYEWSKWECERIANDAAVDLPTAIFRIPTIIAEDATGRVVQFNAFHNTLKLLFYGLLSQVPGDPEAKVPIATAHFVSAALGCLLDPATPLGIYNVCPDPASTPTLKELIDTAFDVFERDEHFVRRRVPRPVVCDSDQFASMIRAAADEQGGAVSVSLNSVVPFAEQLGLKKEFPNDNLRARWVDYQASDPVALTRATTSYLVRTRWGRHLKETA
jgi:nucleoside-diphosphate-sugar epimerase